MDERQDGDRREEGWRYYLRLVLNALIPLTGWLLLCLLGPWLLRFFLPFVIGWVIAMIANPLVRFLERRLRLVRRHSSILIVVAVLALVVGLLYLILSRTVYLLGSFMQALPQIYSGLEEDVRRSAQQTEHLTALLPQALRQNWSKLGASLDSYLSALAGQMASPTVEAAGSVAKGIPAALVYAVVTILSAYFFIVDREPIMAALQRHMPEWAGRYSRYLREELRRLIGGYFLAQFKIMFVVWVILTIGFFVLGVRYGILWGLLIAVLDFLPVFGTGTALLPWGVIKLLGGDYAFAAGLLLIYVLTQVVRQIIQPKLVGDTMGLNPFITLLLLYLGFKVRGIAGMILAVPIGLFVRSLYRYGAFRSITDNVRELVRELQRFRRGL